MSLTIQENLSQLNKDLTVYGEVTRKTPEDVLKKQVPKLGFLLSQQLKKLAPGKGGIRAERLAALEAGGGIHIRDSVRLEIMPKLGARQELDSRRTVFGKRGQGTNARGLNLQALMVQRELNVRESGRGFTAFSAKFQGLRQFLAGGEGGKNWFDRYTRFLAGAGFLATADSETSITLSWGGGPSSDSAARSLNKPAAQEAINKALTLLRADIDTYVQQKLRDNFQQVFA